MGDHLQGPKPVIGLLGGIGAGKSLVARLMAQEGCGVIDADDLARRALDSPAVRSKLVARWGAGLLAADGHVDRKALAAIVFENPKELRELEAVTHPRVNRQRRAQRRRADGGPGHPCRSWTIRRCCWRRGLTGSVISLFWWMPHAPRAWRE